jgi:hypothetical protein
MIFLLGMLVLAPRCQHPGDLVPGAQRVWVVRAERRTVGSRSARVCPPGA